MRMNECEFTKKIYESTIEGRVTSKGETTSEVDRVEEYWRERAGGRGLECA